MSANIAEQLEDDEQFDKAYLEYKKMYANTPKSIDILERLGHLAMILDKKDEAQEYYTKILELDMTNIMAYEQLMDIYVHTDRYKYYVSRGNLHIVQKEFSHGISDFKKALGQAQTEEETNSTRFILATLYEQTGKIHQAIDEYLRIIDSGSSHELVFLKLAQLYVTEDSISSAIETLEQCRSVGFDTANVKENLAQLYLRNNQPEKVRDLTEDNLVKAKSLLDEGKNKEAFEILDKIKTDFARNSQYRSLLAQYYFNNKEWAKALESVNEFDKLEKNSPLTYQMRALILEEQGDDFEAHINWAKYNLSKKNESSCKDIALNEYLSAYQLKENDAEVVRNIAELMEDLGDKNQAAEFWERLADIEPTNKKALEKLAEFKENIGDYRAQADILEKWYEVDKRNTIVIKNLAKAYERIKNKDKALQYYNKFIMVSPVNADYELVKAKIAKLESMEMEEDEGLIGKLMKMLAR